ncbi:hypothetical protein Glove_355g53 [Diversispora epigaea]|uniref:Protein kinase domain-containing protein n=1 Tax=Diversispora epigaea TaxID=1348612 RepID=A0A397HC32_9GLOM|nr:hypothetical protein Glove_355g53 [Diversispora epigaea]
MFFSNNKDLIRIAEDRKIKKFDYNTFEDIEPIARGGFGSVNRAYSKDLKKQVADDFYKAFMNELRNIIAVNHHKNIVKYYGVSINHLVEKCYLVLQYAEDDNLRNYLRNNFKDLNWKTKIKMAQDITNGLSKSLDTNSNSFVGGMHAYLDPEYLRNPIIYKRSKASDIYSFGVLFWELSSVRAPSLEISKIVIYGKRETPINGTPEDYIKIYSDAWKDNPNQRPTIEEICDSLKNIQFESIQNNSNENNQHIQIEVYNNNQLNNFKSISIEAYSRDSVSSNQISFGNSINQENLEITVLGNPGESSTLSPNSYDQEWFNNELKKYGYNDLKILKRLNDEKKVTLKSNIVDSMELFVNEYIKLRYFDTDLNSSNYILVFEYSNDETLRNYLKFNFEKLEWPNKLKLAQQIAKAIEYFHSFDIFMEICNFGISKLVIEPSIDLLNSLGLIEYSDPILLKAEGKFSRTKASDIYSVGILLWEISNLNSSNYILVFEYSNDETLRNYLKFNFEKLEWPNKLKLAQQIAKAIEYFHSFDIFMEICNFGISKLVIEPSIDLLNSLGLIEYSDPILLKAEGKFSRTKASDIYSVGILLWEISSGKLTYYSYEFRLQAREIMEEKDESRLKDKFSSKNGYCWIQDPEQRPNIEKVIQELEHVAKKIDNLNTHPL